MSSEYGTGALRSPPDDRDLVVTPKQLEHLAAATNLPATYRVPTRPPINDQGMTPQCVAYSSAYEQNEQDQREHGRFYDFDEGTQFYLIGGNSNGAVMRNALDRMLAYGYPERGGGNADRHRIDGYFRVAFLDTNAIKQAIAAFGGVLVIMQWFQTWQYPGLDNVLPAPGGTVSGHGFWAVGWDDHGNLIGQNSWGRLWGDNGLFKIPLAYIRQYAWEVWKTADEQTLSLIAKAVIKKRATWIRRPSLVVGDDAGKLGPRSIWGQARRAGIWRRSTDSIVVRPWDKAFKYKGRKHGARHGIGQRPETWAILGIAGTDVAIPAPQVRLVNG